MALGKNKIEKEKDMKVILIGAGNLATHLGKAIFAAGHDVVQVFSRTMQSATALASEVGAQPVFGYIRCSLRCRFVRRFGEG